MMHTTSSPINPLLKLGILSGIIAPVWWTGIIIVCGARFPGYSHINHFISELAAQQSPTQSLMRNAGFYFTGGLYVVFAFTVIWMFRRDWRAIVAALLIAAAGAARIGAGWFPCEPGCDPHVISLAQEYHQYFAQAGYFVMMIAALASGFALSRYQGLSFLLAAAIGAAAWCAMFLAMLFIYPEWQGIFQRLASGVLSLWLLAFACALWRYASRTMAPTVVSDASHMRLKRRERRAAERARRKSQ